MLPKGCHVMLGTVDVGKVESWVSTRARFVQATTETNFHQEVQQVYNSLVSQAKDTGVRISYSTDLNDVEKFTAKAIQDIAVSFAVEVAKAPFMSKSIEEVEEETISSASWITAQIANTRKIIWQTIEIKAREETRSAFLASHPKRRRGDDDCACYE